MRLPEKLCEALSDVLAAVPSSCRRLAARPEVDKMTAWRWRMRLAMALDRVEAGRQGMAVFCGIVEADEAHVRESRKGSREWVDHARELQQVPRPPRPRWQDFRQCCTSLPAARSRSQVPVLTLTDRAGAHGAEMLPDRRAESLVAVLEAQISRDAVLCSDCDGAQPASIAKAVEGVPHSFFA